MELDSLKPNNAEIVIACIILLIFGIIHYVYGIRFRCVKLSQSKSIISKESSIEPLLSSASIQQEVKKIKILSQNVWCVFGVGGSQRRKRLKLLIKNIKIDNPDIVCLQEMHLLGLGFLILCGDYLFVKKELIKLGYIYHNDPKLSTPYFGSSSGCVIFSKFPIINSSSNVFKNKRFARYKGWVHANIAIPNIHNLKIINLHLEHKDKDLREKQINEIVCDINDDMDTNHCIDIKGMVLCLGDFNVCSNDSFGDGEYGLLCKQMRIVGLNTDLYNETERTYSKIVPRQGTQSLDHLFINDECKEFVGKCQLVDYKNDIRIMSDHLGLMTTFQFS